jgi:hypothetical protein
MIVTWFCETCTLTLFLSVVTACCFTSLNVLPMIRSILQAFEKGGREFL